VEGQKEKSLSSKIVFGRGEWGTKKIIRIEDVREAVLRIIERVKKHDGCGSPNILTKSDVIEIIKEEAGEELSETGTNTVTNRGGAE